MVNSKCFTIRNMSSPRHNVMPITVAPYFDKFFSLCHPLSTKTANNHAYVRLYHCLDIIK